MTVAEILQRGVEALRNGDVRAALASADAVLARHPELSVAHLVRARALLEDGNWRDAIEATSTATRLAPGSAEAQATHGSALLAAGRTQDALAAYERALELAPHLASVQTRAAALLLEQGELEQAERLYLAAEASGSESARAGLLALHERRGDLRGAEELLERAGDLRSAALELKLAAARVWRRARRSDEALALLETIELERCTPAQRVAVLHALGDALDETGQPQRAFAAWKRANELRGLRFDAEALEQLVDIACTRLTRRTFAALPRAEHRDERPVLVVGVPRSGTSLVEQMLAAHPQVAGAGELDCLQQLTLALPIFSSSELGALAARYSARLDQVSTDALRVTDKLPHNAFRLGEIALLLPAARVVYVRRDPLDVGLSIFSRNFHATHDYATDLAAIGAFQRQYRRVMEHWKQHLPLPIVEIEYEALVNEPEARARELVEFLGLDWDPAVLRFHESGRTVSTASYAQVRQPLYRGSIGRAERYADELAPLRAALGADPA